MQKESRSNSGGTVFCDSSSDVYMATNFVAKLPTPPALIALEFRHGMGYRCVNVRINGINDESISCKNFVKFGPVTPEKTGHISELFVRHGKKLAYLVEYPRIYWTDFYDLLTT